MKVPKTDKKRSVKSKNIRQILLLIFFGGIIGFLNGFFGGGGGMVCVPTLEKALKLDPRHAHASAIAVMFVLSLVSGAIYIFSGVIESLPLLTVGLGVIAGGIAGSIALKFIPNKVLSVAFYIIMLLGGVRMLI